ATVRANTMVRKTRSDKKNTICKRCGHECSTLQKLREHLKRKNLCKPLQKQKEVASIQTPIQVPIQKANLQAIQAPEIKAQVESSSVNMSNKEKPHVVIPTLVPELEPEKEAPVLGVDYITEEEAKNWVSPNARKPRERIKTWGARLQKRWKELDLGVEPNEASDLELNDPEAVRLPTLKELASEGGPRPKTQSFRKGNKSKNLINKEFERLGEIKGDERSEKDLEFREQEELGTAVKRRAIAVHRAKVPKSYPDNGNDIRKMLESRRKQFREILEKEFDKRGQFKFALCSLTKFLIDDKPGNEKQGKKNSRTDWLRNKQIIVYNRDEIDDYLSNAFEQILYQVEERGGKSNA
ncbi:8810_t:CDS:1, partial [Ambispora gerdemannii]